MYEIQHAIRGYSTFPPLLTPGLEATISRLHLLWCSSPLSLPELVQEGEIRRRGSRARTSLARSSLELGIEYISTELTIQVLLRHTRSRFSCLRSLCVLHNVTGLLLPLCRSKRRCCLFEVPITVCNVGCNIDELLKRIIDESRDSRTLEFAGHSRAR
jgi:hypothetical protein